MEALSEAFRKGVLVKRYVSIFVFLGIFCAVHPVAAEQSPPNSFAGQIISGYEGNRVGIGTMRPAATLDVYEGEVKLGSTGAACTPDLAGALRSTANKLQFCDGAGWRNVSLDKAE